MLRRRGVYVLAVCLAALCCCIRMSCARDRTIGAGVLRPFDRPGGSASSYHFDQESPRQASGCSG